MTGMQATTGPDLHAALKQYFGFNAFRPHQEDIVTAALAGENVLGVLPTGAGKSLTFQLPALMQDGLSLVISPLVALMEDQVAQLESKGITTAACCTARTSRGEWEAILAAVRAGEKKLLYVAPERLGTARFHEDIQGIEIRRLVIDEAHCVSEWGHNFRPDYRRIRDFHAMLGDVPVLALTATATPAVRRDILSNLALRKPVGITGDFDRPNLKWEVIETAPSRKIEIMEELLGGLGEGSAIVYATSRKKTESIAEALRGAGFRANYYHAGLPGSEREKRQRAFQAGEMQVMVATIAFGMGVHKDDVRHVIHDSMPRSLEAYYQEAGRAGRDGHPARCTLLYSRGDLRFLHQSIEDSYPDKGALRQIQVAAVKGELDQLADQSDMNQDTLALGLSALRETGYLEGNAVEGYAAIRRSADEGARAMAWLSKHRKATLDRLYAVRGYAESDGCRSKGLLAYFGQKLERCEHCDHCEGTRRRPVEARSRKKSRTKESAFFEDRMQAVEPVLMDHDAKNRFEHLRNWRIELAREWGVPAYQIMNDKTLRYVAANPPCNQASFIAIPGLGEKKWEAFGSSLLAAVAEV